MLHLKSIFRRDKVRLKSQLTIVVCCKLPEDKMIKSCSEETRLNQNNDQLMLSYHDFFYLDFIVCTFSSIGGE